jgi:hypothetical protein
LGLQTAIGRVDAARLQSFTRRGRWIRGAGSCISCKGLPEHALRLLRRRLGHRLLRAVLPRHAPSAAAPGPWLVVLAEQLDEVGGKQPDHAPVALQPSHPPGAIAGIEDLDQVAFYETEVTLCLE